MSDSVNWLNQLSTLPWTMWLRPFGLMTGLIQDMTKRKTGLPSSMPILSLQEPWPHWETAEGSNSLHPALLVWLSLNHNRQGNESTPHWCIFLCNVLLRLLQDNRNQKNKKPYLEKHVFLYGALQANSHWLCFHHIWVPRTWQEEWHDHALLHWQSLLVPCLPMGCYHSLYLYIS